MLGWKIRFCDDDISFEFLKILKYMPVIKLMRAFGIADEVFFLRNDTVKKLLTAVEYQRVSVDQTIGFDSGTIICAVMRNL